MTDQAQAVGVRPRALVVSARLPGRSVGMAGHRICAKHIAQLSETYDVDLFVLCTNNSDQSDLPYLSEICSRVTIRHVPKPEALANLLRNLHLPLPVAIRTSHSILEELRRFAGGEYALAHFEWTEVAGFARSVSATAKQLMCHDVLSELFARRASAGGVKSLFWAWQTRNASRFEALELSTMDRAFVLSPEDAKDLAELGARPRGFKVIAPEFYKVEPVSKSRSGRPLKLLLWGAFSRDENREAAKVLISKIMPSLRRDDIHLIIAGAESDKHFTSSDTIHILGRVDDPAEAFNQSDIGVFPLYHGSGLKIKVIESLYAGLPVITTSVGKEGYDCSEADGLFLAETPEEFIAAILCLADDPEAYEQAASASARWAKRYVASTASGVL